MKLLLLAALIAVTLATPIVDLEAEWHNFKVRYNKLYSNKVEELERNVIFAHNIEKIMAHNKRYAEGKTTYKKGINQFTDLTGEEFIAYVTQHNEMDRIAKLNITSQIYKPLRSINSPASIDYRDKGVVNGVKNQGGCGSCWAFSVVAAIESKHALEKGELLSLSEQNLVDCSTYLGNAGCSGGWLDPAFDYVKEKGIEKESDYPYEGADKECRFDEGKSALKISGFKSIESGNEHDLETVVGDEGPVSAAIYVNDNLQSYESGVFYDESCPSDQVNHGIAIVGYSNDNGNDYWLVRNSWGETWGENGYFRIARKKDSHCAIAFAGRLPIL